ncbi:MAG: serine/threonine protein kinase, partial [Myxococcales bacterium]|nr:serine/threonine protein kinase [Myxococcales bacterium]
MNEARPTVDAVDDSLPAAPLEPADPRAERDWRASVAAGLNDTARYVMLEELARGGMGVVFRAFDDVLKREVALKLLTPRARSHARDRMLREAQALARVSHPNVVQVHDVGELADGVFLAMELVEGETLLERTRASSASWRERLRLFIQAGNGLAAAHRAGLVHRDFKPANVIVGRDGRVRVVDFGLARGLGATRARDDDETADEPREATGRGAPDDSLDMPIELAGPRSTGGPLTLPGSLLGTPAYMAPEQLRREDADARSDQFAF